MIGIALFMLLQAVILDVWTIGKGIIINFTASIMWGMQWVLMTFGVVYALNKKKYNEKEKENKELKEIIALDVQRFMLNSKDFTDRLEYLKGYMDSYRSRRIK